ncbi:MAG: tyrosine-protein phosphatase [Deltaproteobacteria bacterium]|nr:tyrosine-protein phosphatase [Deltaproteobacteria bacterium]
MTDFRERPTHRFDRVANFRDLGGHTTRSGRRLPRGRLFRSGHLGHASDADREILARLGLRKVFDFRTESDIGVDGHDRLPEGAESVRLPMPDPAQGGGIRELIEECGPERLAEVFGGGKAEQMMRGAAAGLVRERREPYAHFLRALAEADAFPALFHCSAGKDRAGWAGSVVLLTLEVPEEEVIEQYLLSNRAADEIIARNATHERETWTEVLRPLLEVRREYVESSLEAVLTDWGSFEGYLEKGLGISERQRVAIQRNLLDDD